MQEEYREQQETGLPEDEMPKELLEENKNLKEHLYDKIPFSVRTMDIFIAVMVALLILTVILGLADK